MYMNSNYKYPILIITFFISCTLYHPNLTIYDVDNKLVNANKFIHDADYLSAAFELGCVIKNAEDDKKIADAMLLLGSCFEDMELNENAKIIYNLGFQKNNKNVNDFIERILSIDFKMGNFDSVIIKYNEYKDKFHDNEYKLQNIYIKALYNLHMFKKLIQVVNNSEDINDIDCEAKMFRGLAFLAEKDTANAEIELRSSVMSCTSITPEAIISCSEIQKGINKIKTLKKIKRSSVQYEYALVNLCWEFIKLHMADTAGDYENKYIHLNIADSVAVYVDDFLMRKTNSPFLPEILMLKAYACMLNKRKEDGYKLIWEAMDIFEKEWAKDSIKTLDTINKLELSVNNYVVNESENIINYVVSCFDDSSKNQLISSNKVYLENIQKLIEANNHMEKIKLFSKRREKVQEDLEYATAIPRPMSRIKYYKFDTDSDKKQTKPDIELEQLKKEVEEMQEKQRKETE